MNTRRQDLSPLFVRNGAIYIVDTQYFLRNGKHMSASPLLYQMPKERSLNIDTNDDWKKLIQVLKKDM